MRTLETWGKHVHGIQRDQSVSSDIQRPIVGCALKTDEVVVRLTFTVQQLILHRRWCDCGAPGLLCRRSNSVVYHANRNINCQKEDNQSNKLKCISF